MRFFASLWLRNLYPIWNAIPSTIQAFLSSDAKRKGLEILHQLERLAPDWTAVSARMKDLGFIWNEDPMGGALNFHQRPWVTTATGKGDCDDWAFVWRELAKPFGETHVFVAKKKGGGWHMLTILDNGVKAHLFSNLRHVRTTHSSNRKALENTFFGYDKTAYVVYLR
jgi:hypothetical protein